MNLTNNQVILTWIAKGFTIPFKDTVVQTVIPRSKFNHDEHLEMSNAVSKLIKLGAITVCKPSNDQFISNIFLAPKPNGGKRFILNLKSLNKFIENTHFKMEDYRTASKLIHKNGFLATIDLKEAYLLIPIACTDRKYLRFKFQPPKSREPVLYEFTAMPYGLSVAPRVFTKIMKEVVTTLRSQGHKSTIYLDDILCMGDTFDECRNNVQSTLNLLQCLGFVINYDKSSLYPEQTKKFLGFIYNSQEFTMSLPLEKRNNIAQLVQKFSYLPECTIREFAKLIGVLIAACPATKYGYLYTKILERQKFIFLQENKENYDAKIKIPSIVLEDLNWWRDNIFKTFHSLKKTEYIYEIYTDASLTGWGAVCGDKRVNGRWKEVEKHYHINYLELFAVFLGIKSLVYNESNCAILLRVDNTTAISYINRMGGIQFPHLTQLAREIWQWCESRNIWLFASYVNTRHNRADIESRKINPDTEWELSDNAFQDIINLFGFPEIDLFASRSNAKCSSFISWKQDPESLAVDAFTINWKQKYFYAFPPFSLILKCLRKIIDDEATGILVFPYWPSQPWYPLLQNLLVTRIHFFNPSKGLLRSNFRDHHPLHASLTLGAAKLCGQHSRAAASHRLRST